MLETDSEVVFDYTSQRDAHAQITLRNLDPNLVLSFKIKTTKPKAFIVNPSKGFLCNNKQKKVEISLFKWSTPQDVQAVADQEKFMIEYIILEKKLIEYELEEAWTRAKQNSNVKKVKLGIRNGHETKMRASEILLDQSEKRDLVPKSVILKTTRLSNTAPVIQNKESSELQEPEREVVQSKHSSILQLLKIIGMIAILLVLLLSAHSVLSDSLESNLIM